MSVDWNPSAHRHWYATGSVSTNATCRPGGGRRRASSVRARHRDLVVEPQAEEHLHDRQRDRGGREPHLQLDGRGEEQGVGLFVGRVVGLAVHAERDGDRATDEEHADQALRGGATRASWRRGRSAICAPFRAHRTVTAMLLAAPGPPVTELVPRAVRTRHDPSWPPVLVFCVRGGRARRPVRRGRVPAASVGRHPRDRGSARWVTTVRSSAGSNRPRSLAGDAIRAGVGARRTARHHRAAEPAGPCVPPLRRRLGDLLPGRRALRRGVHRAGRGLHHRPVLLALGRRDAGPGDRPLTGRHHRRPRAHRQGERDRRPQLGRDRRRRVHRPPRLHHRRQPRLRGPSRCRSASSSRRPARCASAAARGSATARWCCPAPTSAATSRSARARWSPARCPTSASPSATRRG